MFITRFNAAEFLVCLEFAAQTTAGVFHMCVCESVCEVLSVGRLPNM